VPAIKISRTDRISVDAEHVMFSRAALKLIASIEVTRTGSGPTIEAD
jgi:predicted rRNA methylase YqxC with S4 and FtsJ domains